MPKSLSRGPGLAAAVVSFNTWEEGVTFAGGLPSLCHDTDLICALIF